MMSRRIICNINSTNEEHSTVFIDESNTSPKNDFSCIRLDNLILKRSKISRLKIIVSITIIILLFLLGYFTYDLLMVPVRANRGKLSLENANLSVTQMTINKEDFINTTTEIPSQFTSSKSTNNYLNTSEDIYQKITEGTATTTTKSKGTIAVTHETSTITVTQVTEQKKEACLTNIATRFEEDPGEYDDCTDEPIKLKSKIEFFTISNDWFDCFNRNNECKDSFHELKRIDTEIYHYKHTMYNFLIGYHGILYEGRPLSCSSDDIDLSYEEYDDSLIIIAMPQCQKDSGKVWEKTNFAFVLERLLDCLQGEGILNETYSMEIYESCDSYLYGYIGQDYFDRIKFKEDPMYD